MKKTTRFVLSVLAFCVLPLASNGVFAAQSGTGHYVPGTIASFIDGAPPLQTPFAALNIFNFYDGSASGGRQFIFGGNVAANINATSYCEAPTFAYTSPLSILGGNLALAVSVPYVWLDVDGQLSVTRRRLDGTVIQRTVSRSDSADGIGDVMLIPFWLAWSQGSAKWDVRLVAYAPTGEYEVGRLANVGLNYWTFTPLASFSYIDPKYGYEISAAAGFDFNTENNAIDYQSGDVFHYDMTIAQHLPFFGLGTIGIGANFFFWQQITGDSGDGAVLGPFKGHTIGIGPAASFITPNQKLLLEVKWLPEIDVKNRLQGDSVWFKVAWTF